MKPSILIVSILSLLSTPETLAQERMSLDQFLEKVRAQSLDLKAESTKVDVATFKAAGLAIPPPMIGLTQMREGGSKDAAYGFEINQTIPFPSKLSHDLAARELAADAQRHAGKARESEILAEAKLLYLAHWNIQEKIQVLSEKAASIRDHIKLARSGARSDSFANIHILKAESDLDFLDLETQSLEQERSEKEAAMAALIERLS